MIMRLTFLVLIIVMMSAHTASADGLRGVRAAPQGASSTAANPAWSGSEQQGFQELKAVPSAQVLGKKALQEIVGAASDPTPASVSPRIQYIVFDQPLDTVISEVGKLGGYAVSLSREVTGKVTPGRLEGTADQILDGLKRGNSLVTMKDGPKLIIATEAESTTRIMRSGGEPPGKIRETLRNLRIDDLPKRISIDETSGLVQISAPPVILERIEVILANAARTAATPSAAGLTVVRYGRRSVE
jgi:hypothetical protein